MPPARVSVLTPSLDQARFLSANLDSVRAQGAVVLEHIVIDGGSSDGSAALLAARGDGKLRWRSAPDRGQSDALNQALRLARGDVIGWLNADDVYRPGAARRAVALLDSDPGLGAVYGHCDKIDAAGRVIGRVDAHAVSLESLLGFDTVPQPSCFLRRSVLEEAGGVDEALHYAMDYDLWLRLLLRGARLRAVDEVWAGFRVHGASKSEAHNGRFLPEFERALERALRSPALPAALASRRGALRRRFHTSMARAAYARMELATARAQGLLALRADPGGADGDLLRYLALSALGPRLVRAARRLGSLRRAAAQALGSAPGPGVRPGRGASGSRPFDQPSSSP